MSDPKVGPADPATRRRLMDEHIKRGRAERTYQRPAPKAPAAPTQGRDRRLSTGRTAAEEADRAQRGELQRKIDKIDRETTR